MAFSIKRFEVVGVLACLGHRRPIAGSGVYASRKGHIVQPEIAFKLRNLPWSNIACYTSACAFGFMLLGLAGFFFLGGEGSDVVLLLVTPVLAIVLIVAWLLSAVLTLVFDGQSKRRLIPSLGFVLLFSLGMGVYLFLFSALARIDANAGRRHSHSHPLVHHEKNGVAASEAEKTGLPAPVSPGSN